MGEHLVLAVAFAENERPGSLDNVRLEIYIPVGAPLTVERIVPNVTHQVVDLG
jgi:flagellin FlaB